VIKNKTLKKIKRQQLVPIFAYLIIIVFSLIMAVSLFSCVQENLEDAKETGDPTITPDTTAPTAMKLSTTKESGSYAVGESIDIIIEFSSCLCYRNTSINIGNGNH